jgi:flagellar L-ring protein precursor FlgH
MSASLRVVGLLLLSVSVAPPVVVRAQTGKAVQSKHYQELYERYLAAARKTTGAPPTWMADLVTDPNARRVNDLVTVSVEESIVASGSADATTAKQSAATVDIPLPQIAKELARITPTSTDTNFSGNGGTTRSTQLSATITARVVEVLPSGDLAVEGVREVDINGDRSLIVLTGVIRPIDVLPGNVVPSSRVGQLQIRSLSQGLIKDSLTPGWLVRMINKFF